MTRLPSFSWRARLDSPKRFIFRGYLQRQLETLTGSVAVAFCLQVAIFTMGHYYQGTLRLIPVCLIGCILTMTALWRKSLVPGMFAHAVGDGLMALTFFAHKWF